MSRLETTAWKATSVRYAAVLRAELARTGMSRNELARRVGVSSTAVGYYCQSRYLPRPEIGVLMADALCSGELVRMATAGAVIRCAQCGRERFRGTTRRRYCSDECRRIAHELGVKAPVSGIQAAVDLFCRDCEPEGVCRTHRCQLQPFSPLPLTRRAAV
jgi:DNA-binding XRE family transcriptional regulator